MSDLDVIDARLRKVERHLGFKAAGTQAGHSHAPRGEAAVRDVEAALDDGETVGRVEACETALAALAREVEALRAQVAAMLHSDAQATSPGVVGPGGDPAPDQNYG